MLIGPQQKNRFVKVKLVASHKSEFLILSLRGPFL